MALEGGPVYNHTDKYTLVVPIKAKQTAYSINDPKYPFIWRINWVVNAFENASVKATVSLSINPSTSVTRVIGGVGLTPTTTASRQQGTKHYLEDIHIYDTKDVQPCRWNFELSDYNMLRLRDAHRVSSCGVAKSVNNYSYAAIYG